MGGLGCFLDGSRTAVEFEKDGGGGGEVGVAVGIDGCDGRSIKELDTVYF